MTANAELLDFAKNLQIQGMFQPALLSILLYDHLLTFSEEVERIWKRPLTGASILFLLNRYITPLEFTVVILAFQLEWPEEACRHFVRFEGSGSAWIVGICEIVMILRVYALYGGNKWVLAFLSTAFCAQIAFQAVVLSQGVALPNPLPKGCILIGRTNLYSALWIAPLAVDTCIFVLTLWRARAVVRPHTGIIMPTLQVFLRDGIAYFAAIFSANLLNVIVYFSAEPSLKAFFAPFSEIITSIMISRIVLNLRGTRIDPADDYEERAPRLPPPVLPPQVPPTPSRWGFHRVVGNLGEPVEYNWDDERERHRASRFPVFRARRDTAKIPLEEMRRFEP